ncbi:MAG: DUF3880 domain-containing protein [Desulfovibrionaceae bacterium]
MSHRPNRSRILNEIGLPRTLPSGAASFRKGGAGPEVLFFGLGPEPGKLPAYFPEVKRARFVECPAFEEQMPTEWAARVPEGFKRVEPEDLSPECLRRAVIMRYAENERLFPSFWGPLNARRSLAHLGAAPLPEGRAVWLPGEDTDLLARELEVAFQLEGFQTMRVNPERGERPENLPWLLTQHRPRLFFSVNFKGLDSYGGLYHLLRRSGARVAVWCVDNPFHLLTGVKSNFWKELDLFVTDHWFIEPLRELGAQSVHHLPLAASPGLFKTVQAAHSTHSKQQADASPARGNLSGIDGRLVFVGRSEFPQKREFFSGVRVDEANLDEARALLDSGIRADFGWWARREGVERLWPGNGVRAAGLGAEETGRAWRALCLSQAGPGLTVIGDDAWKTLLPEGTDVRGPVDYYTELPEIYRRAGCVLNMTSPLLPSGLTQRHFDVWTAGGFLLTDDTPGLSIFPEELVREVAFSTPGEMRALLERHGGTAASSGLAAAWREVILSAHTYRHRISAVLAATELQGR